MIEQNNTNNNHAETNESSAFSLYDIVRLMLSNWYWFVISVILCLGCAYLYLASTEKVYNRTATILVKDSRKGGDTDLATFSELAGFSARRNVDNEIYILQSRRLMEQVVRQLNLTMNYSTRRGLRMATLYKESPIEVQFINGNDFESASFEVKLLEGNRASISEFMNKKIALGEIEGEDTVVEAVLGDTINTPVGAICINPTFYLTEEYQGKTIKVGKSSLNSATSSYRKAVQSSVVNKLSSIISLSMRDVVPQRAEDVINTLIAVYNGDAMEDKRAVAKQTASFIDSRLAVISQELGNVDKEIEQFKRKNDIFDLSTEAQRMLSESSKYKSEGLAIENQVAMAKYLCEFLNDKEQENALIPATAGMLNAGIASQISQYNTMLLTRDKLRAEGSENNPTLQNLNKALAANREAIIASLNSHIEALQIQSDALRKEERYANTRIQSASSKEKEILGSIRQQKVKEELYLYLLQKREENELAVEVVEPNSRIVDSAFGSPLPVYPKSFMILAVALIFGLGILFAILYLMEVLDTSIRGRKDIEERTSIPFLGEIPLYTGATNHGIAVRENGRDSVSEAFRILRTNMNFMNVNDKEQKVIMVTSSNPHAGKTFVSVNLALTMAMAGKKTLLVDMDLRRRSLTKVMGHGSDTKGVTSFLSGSTKNIQDLILPTRTNANLHVLYAGVQPPNPAEMLLSERLDELMKELRKEYDYIILDSVPALVVADAMITDRLCDLSLYVVREGLLDRRQLPDIDRFYREKKFHNMTLVLNGASMKSSNFGYGYGYGYDYYGTDEEGSVKMQLPLIVRIKKLLKIGK